ncbi:hypothetical protein GPALN_004461 [Globodera pallida]|nr:hypothetical protein GPALN_004461 [Globodera pallida]
MFARLKIDQVEKTLFNFGKEFFDQTSFGPFLEDYAGLWLLGLDMFPKFAQKPMQISVQKSNKCGLMQNILCKNFQPAPNASEQNAAACKCATFNGTETKHGSHSSNPLILGGKQIDIKTVPWAVRFLGLTNQTGNSSFYTLCGGSLISFEFVLLAAHCFDNVKNGNKFYIGYNSSSAVDFNNNNNGAVNEKHLRHNEINVFIHPKYHTHQTQHDLALIKLNHPVKVLPTCLYCGAAEEFRKGTAFVTGWGQMTDDCKGKTAMAKRLMGRYVQLMECPLKEFVICVEPDTVQTGDSGSALLASNGTHFVQVAVLSSGICNDQTNTSRVNYFSPLDKEWIEKISGVYCPN